jgi:hypothetical protein
MLVSLSLNHQVSLLHLSVFTSIFFIYSELLNENCTACKTVNNIYVSAHSFVIYKYVNDNLIVKLIQPF